ncbi:transposase [Rickettsia monacensis]|nr:transposase [Rickettsia monacensis]
MLHYLSGKRTGIYYADSTHFAVCKNIRINSNRTPIMDKKYMVY